MNQSMPHKQAHLDTLPRVVVLYSEEAVVLDYSLDDTVVKYLIWCSLDQNGNFQIIPLENKDDFLEIHQRVLATGTSESRTDLVEGKNNVQYSFHSMISRVANNNVLLTIWYYQIKGAEERKAEVTDTISRGKANVFYGPDGSILSVNKAAERLLGYSREECTGRNGEMLIEEGAREEQNKRFGLLQDLPQRSGIFNFFMQKRNAEVFYAEEKIFLCDKRKNMPILFAICRDISKFREQEEKVRSALAEKDMRLREAHHRMKNQLQLIISMISLQLGQLDSHDTIAVLNELKARIHSISLIHEYLGRSERVSAVSASDYLNVLCNAILQTYDVQNRRISP